MQIIIPMSGFGERFRRVGYKVPKPLIEIDGKPIVGHVVDMFPGETDITFICNQDHLNEPSYRMEQILKELCPTGRVIGIEPHKLGPIHAVNQISDVIDLSKPTIVNYCDFTCYWDWAHFCEYVAQSGCQGAIPAYKGFHPHTLGTTNYAYMKEVDGWVQDIQEKQPYTDNRMEEYASSGTYYFATGQVMLDAFKAVVEQDLNLAGEYYVSLAYKPLFAANASVAVYDLQHFMQWGTPQDVAEYNSWSKAFDTLSTGNGGQLELGGSVVVPMAGMGQRFFNEGYTITKPLIPLSGKPMVVQSTHDLPKSDAYSFVLRSDMPGFEDITQTLKSSYDNAAIETVPEVTEGQACSALLGLDALENALGKEAPGPVTFGACDYGSLYDEAKLKALCESSETDVIVWAVRGYANAVRYPEMYGWIDVGEDGETIKNISVKKPLGSPESDPIVLGTFTFKRGSDFRNCLNRLIERDGRVNGEFYLDTCVNDAMALGLNCKIFEVDSYLSWGTPNDLRTFEYWQSCFHKWQGHQYQLQKDSRIPAEEVPVLESLYKATVPQFLKK